MSHWPSDLATSVNATLAQRYADCPSERTLRTLFDTMYFASLRTEETQAITFHLVYLNPEEPDPSPPEIIVQDRWKCVALERRLPFDLSSITKIAKASDPRSSSLAVYHNNKDEVFIWGLIDQGNSYYDFVNYNAEEGPERPGLFQASIAGVGHVVVYCGYELIADLRVNELRQPAINVLEHGPVYEALFPGIRSYLESVRSEVPPEVYADRDPWDAALTGNWLSALRRLLLRIQQYRHGGAVLITSDRNFADLNIKYQVGYDRLRTALRRRAVFTVYKTHAFDQIFNKFIEKENEVPMGLVMEEFHARGDLDETRDELDGVLWFVSLLSRVDGLVLLTPDLEVVGFGVEIQTSSPPRALFQATDWRASRKSLRAIDYNHFGTRHRSMMRYCAAVYGTIGFVISQDGDVRTMTRIDEQLVLWENIKLRQDDFERHRRRKR